MSPTQIAGTESRTNESQDIFLAFYPLARRAAEVRIAGAVAAARLTADEREDWIQELLLASWRALPRYDNTRGSLRTFAERIVANGFSSLMRARRLQRPVERTRQSNYRVDRGGGWDYRLRAAQAEGVSSASR